MTETTRLVKLSRVAPGALALAVALVLCGSLVSACTTSPPAGAPTTSSAPGSGTGAGSSTTTTPSTLPAAVPVGGSVAGGALGPIGAIYRVSFVALAPGHIALDQAAAGSPEFSRRVTVAFRRFGSGPDLVLVAGQDTTMSTFGLPLLSALAAHFRVTVFDLPGTGFSGPPTAPLSVEWLADVTAGLTVALSLVHPIVVGWGLGGQVAIAMAARHSTLLSSLVLVDSAAGGKGSVPPGSYVSRLLAGPALTPSLLARLLFTSSASGRVAASAWKAGLVSAAPDYLTEPAVGAEATLQRSAWADRSLSADLARLSLPVLVVHGLRDVVFPAINSIRLAEQIQGASRLVLPGAYGAIVEDPSAFVEVLSAFAAG